MDFYVEHDQHGRATWWLYSMKHGLEAQASESFEDLEQARAAVRRFRSDGDLVRYEVHVEVPGRFRWRMWRETEKLAVSAGPFSTRGDAVQAARRVLTKLPTATIP